MSLTCLRARSRLVGLGALIVVAAMTTVPSLLRAQQRSHHVNPRDDISLSVKLNWLGYAPTKISLAASHDTHDAAPVATLPSPERSPHAEGAHGPAAPDEPNRRLLLAHAPPLHRGPPASL